MKIILATESYTPTISGVAVSVSLLAQTLATLGHQVWVFAPSTDFSNQQEQHPRWKNLSIHRFRSLGNPFRADHRVSFRPKAEVKQLIEKIQPDLIHLQDPNIISSAALEVAKRKHIPVIMTNHFMPEYALSYLSFLGPAKPLARRKLMRYLQQLYNQCGLITTPTETIAGIVRQWGVIPHVKAISNGVLFERFSHPVSQSKKKGVASKYGIPLDKPIILYVGRIDKDKSLHILMEAIPKVLATHAAHFVFVGRGNLAKQYRAQVKDKGLTSTVTFTGAIAHDSEELPALYQLGTIFVIPSEIETQSIVTLEAMSAGLPIIGADAGALRELIIPDQNGTRFEPGDSENLAQTIVELLNGQDNLHKLGQASQEIAKVHDLKHAHRAMIDLYETLLAP